MSESKHPVVQKLHDMFIGENGVIWKDLPLSKEQKAAIKQAAEAITDQYETITSKPPRFSEPVYEAFTSQHGSLVLPTGDGAGVLWEITTRADTPDEILGQLMAVQEVALRAGFLPADRYIDQRRQERKDTIPFSFEDNKPERYFEQRQPVATSQPNGQQTMITQLTKIAAGPLSDKDTTLVYKGMTGKSKHLVNIYMDSGAAALQKLTGLGLDPNQPATLFAKGVTEIPTPGWTCLVGLTEDGKWANKILDITPAK